MPTPVSFYSNYGLKLAGILYTPPSTEINKPLPAIVLCQGLSGVKEKVLPQVAEHFIQSGFIVLAFDYRGCGESSGDPHQLFPLARCEDIASAIAYIQSVENVDVNRIGLYGISYGAATSLYAASLSNHIKCTVAVSGAIDGENLMRGLRTVADFITFKKRLEHDQKQRALTGKSDLIPVTELIPFPEGFWEKYNQLDNKNNSESIPGTTNKAPATFTLESAQAMTQFNIANQVAAHLTCPTLIIHGEVDNIIAVEDVRAFYTKLNTIKKLTILPNKDHIDLDHGPGLQEQLLLATKWFTQYLQTK